MPRVFDERFMRRAIALSADTMAAGDGGPFGAVIVRAGRVLAEGVNQVTSANDPTAHAEIVAIRRACAALGRFDLAAAVIYTSCEPCPMCLGAIYWARIAHIYYGNDRADAARIGFDDDLFYREIARPRDSRSMPMTRLLAAEALAIFDGWVVKPDKVLY
jgi:tRNA(Arg) A34 adenosine deaminase TadA